MKRLTTSDFIERAKSIHGDKYGYDKVQYQTAKIKVTITCLIHGDFKQDPYSHLTGGGCQTCGINARVEKSRTSQEEFIKKAKKVHGNKYNYDKTIYQGAYEELIINCPTHGDFKQKSTYHLNGGCKECAKDISRAMNEKRKHKSSLVFVKKAKVVHGNKYNYDKVEYNGAHEKIVITCPIHGDFKQSPAKHIGAKRGCPPCGLIKMAGQLRKTKEQFIKESIKIHGDKYDYSNIKYINDHTNIEIVCVRHGSFSQNPGNHIRGNGCPYCTLTPQSKQELTITFELIKFFKDINPKGFKTRVKGKLWSIDIYIPQLKLGIEFDGSYWHKDKRALDKLKTENLEEEGFEIFRVREEPLKRIFDDDIMSKQPFNAKQVANDILTQIMSRYSLNTKKIAKIESYIAKKELQNEKGLDKYIEMILIEKAEKKK